METRPISDKMFWSGMREVLTVAGVAGAAFDWLTSRFLHCALAGGPITLHIHFRKRHGRYTPGQLEPSLFSLCLASAMYCDCLALHRIPDAFDHRD